MAENGRNRGGEPRTLGDEIGRKAARKWKARREQRRAVWFGLGMFGLVGWAVAVPTLVGTAAGLWLDRHYPDERLSWTLSLLIIGIVAGCLNSWYWIRHESGNE